MLICLFCFVLAGDQPPQAQTTHSDLPFVSDGSHVGSVFKAVWVCLPHLPLRVIVMLLFQFKQNLCCFFGSVRPMSNLWASSWFMLDHIQKQRILFSKSLLFRISPILSSPAGSLFMVPLGKDITFILGTESELPQESGRARREKKRKMQNKNQYILYILKLPESLYLVLWLNRRNFSWGFVFSSFTV